MTAPPAQRLAALRTAMSDAQTTRARAEAQRDALAAQLQHANAAFEQLGCTAETAPEMLRAMDTEIEAKLAQAEAALERTQQ